MRDCDAYHIASDDGVLLRPADRKDGWERENATNPDGSLDRGGRGQTSLPTSTGDAGATRGADVAVQPADDETTFDGAVPNPISAAGSHHGDAVGLIGAADAGLHGFRLVSALKAGRDGFDAIIPSIPGLNTTLDGRILLLAEGLDEYADHRRETETVRGTCAVRHLVGQRNRCPAFPCPFRTLSSRPFDLRQRLAGAQHDGSARRGRPYQHNITEWP